MAAEDKVSSSDSKSSHRWQHDKSSHCCGCFHGGSHKISPSQPTFSPHQQVIEVSPGRFICVKHVRPKRQFQNGAPNPVRFRSSTVRRQQFSGQGDVGDLSHPNAVEDQQIVDLKKHSNTHTNNIELDKNLNGQAISNADLNEKSAYENGFTYQRLKSSNEISRAATASNVSVHIKPPLSAVTFHGAGNHSSVGMRQKPPIRKRESQLSLITVTDVKSASMNSSSHAFKNNSSNANAKAVIFCIHGVGGSSDVWQAQVDYFADQGYEVVSPDLIGHGFSCSPQSARAYTFTAISADLFAIFDKYRQKRNIVVGHSYGSCFATMLAHKRPRMVDKLILVSGGGPTPLYPQPGLFSMPSCILSCVRPALMRAFKKSAFHGDTKTYVPREKAFDVPAYVLKYTMNGQHWLEGDIEFHKGLVVPTLLVYGENDRLVSLEEEQEMEKAIHGSRLVVLRDASHMVMMERPAQVNQLMHEFIDNTVIQSTNQRQQGILSASNQSLDNLSVQDL